MKTFTRLPLVALASALSLTAAQAQTTTPPTAKPAPGTPAPTDPKPAPGAPAPKPAPGAPAPTAPKPAPGAPVPTAPKPAPGAPAPTAPKPAPGAPAPMEPKPAPGAPAPMAPKPAPGTAMAAPAAVAPNPDVGGAKMDAAKTIVANAATAPNLTTLVKAVQAAGLAETLSGPGPFTVFAPTNDAFGRLQPGTVDSLLKPENKAVLVKALTYHVVPGNISATQLLAQIDAGGGKATLNTVEGAPLTATKEALAVVLTDVNGNKSYIETPDVRQSNGVVHVVNGVLLPKLN